MPAFAPATDVSEIELPEPGKYIVKCVAIEDAPDKGFGPGVKWVFQLIDPASGTTTQSQYGGDYELWQFTSVKMGPKSKARPIIEALLGRPLDVANREVPDPRQLIGRSMIAMVIHEKRDDGTDKATVTSCKPYTQNGAAAAPTPAPTRSNGLSRPTPGPGLIEQVRAAIRKAEILQTPNHLEWLSIQPDGMSDSDLFQVLEEINADIRAA